MSYENDEGAKVHGDRRQQTTMTRKFQSLSIFITSFFTTTPLTIYCSSIICHSTSSIPVKGEYQPSLKDFLIVSQSSSEAPASTSNKTESATAFMDIRPRPLTLVERGAHRAPTFHKALVPHFLFSVGATETRGGTSMRVGTTRLAMGRRASAFEEKPNNAHK
jgi:hypothetical protein